MPHAAPDSGVVERVQVREGTQVRAGAPLLQIRNLDLERQLLASLRTSDSLTVRVGQARGQGRFADVALVEALRSVELARLAGLETRREALRIRALGSGIVVTSRPEELIGRWVSNGELLLELGQSDSVEIRIAISGAGGTQVRPGSRVRLLSEAAMDRVSSRITTVSVLSSRAQTVEARLRLPASDAWRPGMRGRAKITLKRSNAWGALWWSIRRGIRSDILL
jgi:multidrug efflux pump subunit AcrA (membrane-fusion protein)